MRLSFELFPPKTPEAEAQLEAALPRLAALGPDFFTVTYGAGGTTKDGTLATCALVAERTGRPVAAHLTYLTTPRDELLTYAKALWSRGIRHILALRGDLPPGKTFADFAGATYFSSTAQFIGALRDTRDFEISVAAYPEVHPDAADAEEDIDTLRAKVAAGAQRAITQFFFDDADYWALCENASAAGVEVPILPGLLPVADFPGMARFAAKCCTRVPEDLEARLAALGAAEVLAQQIRALAARGADHIHLYTLNRADVVEEAVEKLDTPPQTP